MRSSHSELGLPVVLHPGLCATKDKKGKERDMNGTSVMSVRLHVRYTGRLDYR